MQLCATVLQHFPLQDHYQYAAQLIQQQEDVCYKVLFCKIDKTKPVPMITIQMTLQITKQPIENSTQQHLTLHIQFEHQRHQHTISSLVMEEDGSISNGELIKKQFKREWVDWIWNQKMRVKK